jgi:hypothetical protein
VRGFECENYEEQYKGKSYTQIQAFPFSLAINIFTDQTSSMHLRLSNTYAYATQKVNNENEKIRNKNELSSDIQKIKEDNPRNMKDKK